MNTRRLDADGEQRGERGPETHEHATHEGEDENLNEILRKQRFDHEYILHNHLKGSSAILRLELLRDDLSHRRGNELARRRLLVKIDRRHSAA